MADEDLKKQLKAWSVAPEIPPGFQREVWARIATRDARREASVWQRFQRWFLVELPRPRNAAAAILVALLGSTTIGLVQAREANAAAWKTLETRYTRSFNPLMHFEAHGQS